MKIDSSWLIYLMKEIYKFVTYYPCTFISRFIDFYHYRLLTLFPYPIFTVNPAGGIIGSRCYGNLWAVKNATKESYNKKCMIEHGVYFGEYVIEEECLIKEIDTIYTYSEYRKKAILKWFNNSFDKKIIVVGPYILYANHFYPEKKLIQMKKNLGKVLLVFPAHQSFGANVIYDENDFLGEIAILAKEFDTVMISLFWIDVRKGYAKQYEEKGYTVVCSGQRVDRWFLSRQKDLFYLADFSISNSIGTHIGYSIAMGVPHYVYNQNVKITGAAEFSKDVHNIIRQNEYDALYRAFSSKDKVISKEQVDIVKHFWGDF